MAEYIERKAIEETLNRRYSELTDEYGPYDQYTDGYGDAISVVENFSSAVGVVPVVRCKDCKHLLVYNTKEIYAFCPKINTVFLPFELDTRTHFCSCGERKETNNDDSASDTTSKTSLYYVGSKYDKLEALNNET